MKRLIADVRGIYSTTIRILFEPKVLKTYTIVSLLYGAIFVAILIGCAVLAILSGLANFEYATMTDVAVWFGISLVLFFPANILVARLIRFSVSIQPRYGFFQDFRVVRCDWVSALMLELLLLMIFCLTPIAVLVSTEISAYQSWAYLIIYSSVFCALSICILIPATVFAVRDSGGWATARSWLRDMFMSMFIAYLMLTIASGILTPAMEWSIAASESSENFIAFNAIYFSIIVLLSVMLILMFAILPGGYRYWRETYAPAADSLGTPSSQA